MPAMKSFVALSAMALLACACTASSPANSGLAAASPTGPGAITSSQPARSQEPSVLASPSSAYRSLALPTVQPAPTCAQAVRGHDVASLIAAFRAARLAGRGAESCLTRSALRTYVDAQCTQQDLTRSPGPVVLYHCGQYRVAAIPPDRIQVIRTDDRDVQLDIQLSGPGKSAAATYEHLRVGTGTPAVGPASSGLVITSVASI